MSNVGFIASFFSGRMRKSLGSVIKLSAADEEVRNRAKTDTQYRRLISNIAHISGGQPYSIAITSALSGEGVTTITANLAITLARSIDKNVVLVDLNLINPKVHESFNVGDKPGVKQIVEENFDLSLAVQSSNISNLKIIASGGKTEHSAKILSSEKIKKLIEDLKNDFSYIIIDCSSILASMDATFITPFVDGTLIVVRSNITPRNEVIDAMERINRDTTIGVILNG